MNNKETFSAVGISLLANLLLLPSMSFAVNNHVDMSPVLYVSGQYRPGVSHFSNFSVKETHHATKKLVKLKEYPVITYNTIAEQANFQSSYVAEFEDNAISFSGAVGFSCSEGLRIEIEASYEEFDVKNSKGSSSDDYRYFAVARPFQPPGNQKNPKYPKNLKYTVMKNNGLSIGSVTMNSCYDFTLDDTSVSPYICLGIGGDFIEFFDELHVKLAYQGKIGISYPIYPKTSIFANGYYHKVIGNKFKNLHVQDISNLDEDPKVTSAVAILNVSYFGGEIGARFTF